MDICILGAHNSESEASSCICFLIDNTLAIDAGGLTSNLSISDQQKLEAILLTHQHYDHIRDIPGLALNMYKLYSSIKVYSTASVRSTIENHLLNGQVYPKFQELPTEKPSIAFEEIKPYVQERIDGHNIKAIPVNHPENTVGYQISDNQGKVIFYTADTGPGLSACWEHSSPQLVLIDVTLPNDFEDFARETGHLTPNLLKQELVAFREQKGYLPQVIAVHMDSRLETEIREELAVTARELNIPIGIAQEGMQLHI